MVATRPPTRRPTAATTKDTSIGTTRRHRGGRVALLAGLLGLAVNACAIPVESNIPATAPLADQLIAFRGGASFTQPLYRSPAEASPLTVFEVDGERRGPVSDLLVVGVVESVEAGIGYSWPSGPQIEGEASTRETHDFNDPEAWISSIHLVVRVQDSLYLDSRFEGLSSVRIGLSLLSPVDLDALQQELEGTRIAAPLIANESTAFDLEPDAFGVVDHGALLGFVDDESGLVSFPALDLGPYPGPDTADSPIPLVDLLRPPELVRLKTVAGLLVEVDA